MSKKQALHWLMVGYVSDGAKAWIERVGGKVITLHQDPTLIGVALAYDPDGAWTWSNGEQQLRKGIEYWTTGEIQEASTGITLQYGSTCHARAEAEYYSADTTYLILPDEEFDHSTGTVKPLEIVEDARAVFPTLSDEDLLGDLDQALF
jgi:hypothetical protein